MPLRLDAKGWRRFQKIRKRWYRDVRPIDGHSPSNAFVELPLPSSEAFQSCTVFGSRFDLIRSLPAGGRWVEVGTQQGLFAEFILKEKHPDELYLIDVDFAPLLERVDSPLHAVAECRQGDSSTLLDAFPDDFFDVIYVDGDHSLNGATRDAAVAVRKVRPGGTLCFNDFTIWSPVECIDYGVPYVVCDLINELGWPVTHFALHPLGYHDIAITRPLVG